MRYRYLEGIIFLLMNDLVGLAMTESRSRMTASRLVARKRLIISNYRLYGLRPCCAKHDFWMFCNLIGSHGVSGIGVMCRCSVGALHEGFVRCATCTEQIYRGKLLVSPMLDLQVSCSPPGSSIHGLSDPAHELCVGTTIVE